MVELTEESSNQLFDTLADWNTCLDALSPPDPPVPRP